MSSQFKCNNCGDTLRTDRPLDNCAKCGKPTTYDQVQSDLKTVQVTASNWKNANPTVQIVTPMQL